MSFRVIPRHSADSVASLTMWKVPRNPTQPNHDPHLQHTRPGARRDESGCERRRPRSARSAHRIACSAGTSRRSIAPSRRSRGRRGARRCPCHIIYTCSHISPEPIFAMHDVLLRLVETHALGRRPVRRRARARSATRGGATIRARRIGRAPLVCARPRTGAPLSRVAGARRIAVARDRRAARRSCSSNCSRRPTTPRCRESSTIATAPDATTESPVGEIITHVTMHGGHHRGQIARVLRQAGREPPYTDYIQFSRRDQ